MLPLWVSNSACITCVLVHICVCCPCLCLYAAYIINGGTYHCIVKLKIILCHRLFFSMHFSILLSKGEFGRTKILYIFNGGLDDL